MRKLIFDFEIKAFRKGKPDDYLSKTKIINLTMIKKKYSNMNIIDR